MSGRGEEPPSSPPRKAAARKTTAAQTGAAKKAAAKKAAPAKRPAPAARASGSATAARQAAPRQAAEPAATKRAAAKSATTNRAAITKKVVARKAVTNRTAAATEPAAPPPEPEVGQLMERLQRLEAELAARPEPGPPPARSEEPTLATSGAAWAVPEPVVAPAAEDAPQRHFPGPRWLGVGARWTILTVAGLIVLGLLIVSVGPKFLPYQALVVRSGSMSPTIPTGSIVFYHKEPADQVKVGQIIVFAEPNNPNVKVTHRVYRVETGPSGRFFLTKGDANGSPDDWQVPAVGTGWVAGFHLADVGYFLADLQSTTARFLLLVIPAFALGGITLYEMWRPRRDQVEAATGG